MESCFKEDPTEGLSSDIELLLIFVSMEGTTIVFVQEDTLVTGSMTLTEEVAGSEGSGDHNPESLSSLLLLSLELLLEEEVLEWSMAESSESSSSTDVL